MRNLLRNLAYASVIVAATAVTVHQLGASATAAPAGQAGQAGCVVAASGRIVLLADGRRFYQDTDNWAPLPPVLPFPVENVAFFGGEALVDINGNGWAVQGAQWRNNGSPGNCNAPVNVEPSTWSRVKVGDRRAGE